VMILMMMTLTMLTMIMLLDRRRHVAMHSLSAQPRTADDAAAD
jgi:hypothetical protein